MNQLDASPLHSLLGTSIHTCSEKGRTHAGTSCERQDSQEGSSAQAHPQQTRQHPQHLHGASPPG